jgi:hypothetical protein
VICMYDVVSVVHGECVAVVAAVYNGDDAVVVVTFVVQSNNRTISAHLEQSPVEKDNEIRTPSW